MHRRDSIRAEAVHLPVAEPAAVGPALQGVATAHDSGVEAGQEERADPDAQIAVIADPARVRLVTEVGLGTTIGAERIRGPRHPALLGTNPHLVLLPRPRRQRPAADAALQRGDDQRCIFQVTGVIGAGRAKQQQHAKI